MKVPPGLSGGNKSSNSMASRAVGSGAMSLDNQNGNKSKLECFQEEREKFLLDFERPSQVCRFMRERMIQSPTFLYRNLAYMRRRRMSRRTFKARKDSHVDDILEMALKRDAKQKESFALNNQRLNKNFYNLIILGFCDGEHWQPDTEAKLDLQIVRHCMKKRKESQGPVNKAFQASCNIKIRSPATESVYNSEFTIPISKGKYPVLSVPKDCFNLVNGHIVQMIKLLVRVSIPASALLIKSESGKNNNLQNGSENPDGEKNGSRNNNNGSTTTTNTKLSSAGSSLINSRKLGSTTNSNDGDEPKPKRLRSLPTKDRENFIYDNTSPQQTQQNKSSNNNSNHTSPHNIVYVGYLTIYDKDENMNVLAQENSDLELRLTRAEGKKSGIHSRRISRQGSWAPALEEVSTQVHSRVQEYLHRNGTTGCVAKLALAIRATNEQMASPAPAPAPVTYTCKKPYPNDQKMAVERVRVIYQFVHNTHGSQLTEARDDARCPWCSINCIDLYPLLQHLKICHPRFQFSCSPIAGGARVDVTINESYDGSYTGSAFDLVAQPPGEAFARNGPAKRTQVFQMLVFRPPRVTFSLDEFFDADNKDGDQRRSYITGHNRLYHHTTTCLPIHPREIDVDSEGEPDPEWLKVKTCMMIDEFTDVNEGEKEIMKMWNHHVMHDNYVGDCQIPLACKRFVERYGQTIIQKNLYRNFILHLTNLFDFGLLPAQSFHSTIQLLHSQMRDNNTASSLRDSWRASSVSGQSGSRGNAEDMIIDIPASLYSGSRHTNGNTAITSETDKNGHAL